MTKTKILQCDYQDMQNFMLCTPLRYTWAVFGVKIETPEEINLVFIS